MKNKGDRLSFTPSINRVNYADEHRPQNQNHIAGVAINPNLRSDFEMTDHNDWEPDKLKDWWNRPYIVTKTWSDIEEAYEADRALLHTRCFGDCTSQHEQMEKEMRMARIDWFDKYPYGIRYEIRCLDGAVPNRATIWGTEGTLRAALKRIQAGPPWREEHSGIPNRNENQIMENGGMDGDVSELEIQLAH